MSFLNCIKFNYQSKLYAIMDEASSEQNMQLLEIFDTFQLFGKRGRAPEFFLLKNKLTWGTEHFSILISAIQQFKKGADPLWKVLEMGDRGEDFEANCFEGGQTALVSIDIG